MPWRSQKGLRDVIIVTVVVMLVLADVGRPYGLFSDKGFVARSKGGCGGGWTLGLSLLHNISDLLIFVAYLAIPLCIIRAATAKHTQIPRRYQWAAYSFATFIIACGATHMMSVIDFWFPYYRLDGLIKAWTAFASWSTVISLVRALPEFIGHVRPRLEDESLREAQEDIAAAEREQKQAEKRLLDILNRKQK